MKFPFFKNLTEKPLYGFGFSQEDARTEATALDLKKDDRVLTIASAGDIPLSLLAMGVKSVIAVDVDAGQLQLTKLKIAAIKVLSREETISFLGYSEASKSSRINWFQMIKNELASDSLLFWQTHEELLLNNGPIWLGRYELYIKMFITFFKPLLGKTFQSLFECNTLSEQEIYFKQKFNRRLFTLPFSIAFHPKIFSSRGMDPRSLQYRDNEESLWKKYFKQFQEACTKTYVKENYLLQLHLLGHVLSFEAVPIYLQSNYFYTVRENISRLQLFQTDVLSFLNETPKDKVNKVHLSNLPDWSSKDEFDVIMTVAANKLLPGSRLIWRFLHVNRQLPKQLEKRIHTNINLGDKLREKDFFPFYSIVPAKILK